MQTVLAHVEGLRWPVDLAFDALHSSLAPLARQSKPARVVERHILTFLGLWAVTRDSVFQLDAFRPHLPAALDS